MRLPKMGRLFWKILLGFWLTLFLLGVGVAVGITIYQEARSKENALAIGPRADFLSATMALALTHAEPAREAELMRNWPHSRGAPPLVVDEDGRDLLGRPVPARALDLARSWAEASPDDGPVRAVTTGDGRHLLVFSPAGPRRGGPGRPPFVPIQDIRMIMAIMAVVAGLAFSALLARNLARPIRSLRSGFDALAEGRLDTRMGSAVTRRGDELGQLGRDFDSMAQRLGQLVATRDRLLHDISHELRSPLARLEVAVELARRRPETVGVALDRIERESQRLDALVGEVLTMARMESGATMAREDYVDVNELLRTIADDASFENADSARIRIVGDVDSEILMRGQGELLYRAFENVIRNAMRHTPEGTEVEVSVRREAGSVTVDIADQGSGVPESELASIFEPFHRGAGGDGFGLGLAIAQRAIEAHGGRISARNDKGLVVSILLPVGEA